MKQSPKFRVAIPDVARLERLEENLRLLHLEVERYRLAGSAMLSGSQLGDSLTLDFIARLCRGSYQAIILPSPLVVERLWSAALEHRAEEAMRDALRNVRVLAIGERTREALQNNGVTPDHVLSRDLAETTDELYRCLRLEELSSTSQVSEPTDSRGKHIVWLVTAWWRTASRSA